MVPIKRTALKRKTPLQRKSTKKDVRPELPDGRGCAWCGKPIERWERNGRREQLGNFRRRKFCDRSCNSQVPATGLKVVLSELGTPRRVGKHAVYTSPADGRLFVLSKRVDGRPHRLYGEVSSCEQCGADFFHRDTGSRERWKNCSKDCGKRRLRRSKRMGSLAKGGPKKESLDRWFGVLVRSHGSCQRCGTTERLQCCHVVSRRYNGVRFDFANAMCLCARCHMYFTHRPLEWDEYVTEQMGAEAYHELKQKALAFRGPLDRLEIAKQMYRKAEELDIAINGAPGSSLEGIFDSDDEVSPAALRMRKRRAARVAEGGETA